MMQRNQPIRNLDLSALQFEKSVLELEIVDRNSNALVSNPFEEKRDAESQNKFAKYSDEVLLEQYEKYRKHYQSMCNSIKDGGDKLIKMMRELKAEMDRRKLKKQNTCQNGPSTCKQLQLVSDGNLKNGTRIVRERNSMRKTGNLEMHSENGRTSFSLDPNVMKQKNSPSEIKSYFYGRNQEPVQMQSKDPKTTLLNGTFHCPRSSRKSEVPGSDLNHILNQIDCRKKQRCLGCDKILEFATITRKNGIGTHCKQCQSQTRFRPVTPMQLSEGRLVDSTLGHSCTGKKNAGKRGCTDFGESIDTAMELSDDDELQQLKDPLLNFQTHVNDHARRDLCSSFKRREAPKTAYPSRSDPEAIEVRYSDLRHLAPSEFLNDTIIDFYIKYIQRPDYLNSERRKIFHFFNSFFYKKLVLAKRKGTCSDPFSKLRKWTKGVNIFEKTYLLVPIHDSAHWSLAIVCFPKTAVGCLHIFHLDSMSSGHVSVHIFRVLQSYLEAEWKNNLNSSCDAEIPTLSVDTMERVEVPLQENDCDCGLFLLYYIERFVQDAPLQFGSNAMIRMFGRNWFKPQEASHLRGTIRRLLENLLEAGEGGDLNIAKSTISEILMEDLD